MPRLYHISASFLPPGASVVSFDGEEALSRLYRFRILFSLPLAEGLGLDLDASIGQAAQLLLRDGLTGVVHQAYSGMVAALELLDDLERHSLFRLHLVPRLWRLSLGEHSRVFVDKALPEILSETLEGGGLTSDDYELRLVGKYAPLRHVCQLRESRLLFLTRWLERVGAYYFFEQGDERERLIITDSTASHADARSGPVRFVPQHADDVTAGQALRSFRWRHEVVPRKVAVADYHPLHPRLSVKGSADVVPEGAGGEVRLFKVNEEQPDEAQRFATTRALEHLAGRTTCHAHGSVIGLMPGFTFDLVEHPRRELNQAYLVTEARHRGREAGLDGDARERGAEAEATREGGAELYRCELRAVEASRHHLVPSMTRWPRISGTVRARIDGEGESEYAQIDEHGRYRVRLLLDESGLPDGAASTYLRMLQPHAGNPEGMHLPLRKGTEVQVGFLRGDPDQPVIVGVVPDATTPSPVTTANRTQNVVQTGGLSRVEIEDQQGSEYIAISTPPESTFFHLGAHAGKGTHNYVLSTSGDASMHTGGNRDIRVGGKQTESVAGDVAESYHADQTRTVGGALTETVDGGAAQIIHAGSEQNIDGGATITISGGETRTVTGGQTETLSGGRTQTISGSSVETIAGDLTQTIAGGSAITSTGGHTVIAGGGFEVGTPANVTLVANGGFNLLAPGGQRRLDNDFVMFGKDYTILAPNQLVICGHRVDAMGLYVELVGVKADLFGVKQTLGTTAKQAAFIYLGTDGVGATAHAFSQQGGAFHLWGG
ncbi:type VI secretion system Vgr family protein [Sorangium sp. So ce1078]|uniref:type VI secretion system Vgr family protein n=1 Tax=Sorangium sp. So ce1078 TaxID=3133329 RepID=UPI003F5E10B5